MASSLRGLKEYFEQFKENQTATITEVVVLQILFPGPELGVENPLDTSDRRREGFERENNRIQVTDGTLRVHLNFGNEPDALKLLYEPLQLMDYDPEHLDGAYYSIMNFRFSWHWIPEIKEVVVSLDTEDFRLVDAGLGQSKPRKTHYVSRIVSKRRYEIMKREAIARVLGSEKADPALDIDLNEMVGVQSGAGVLADECRVDEEAEGAQTPTFDKKKASPQKPPPPHESKTVEVSAAKTTSEVSAVKKVVPTEKEVVTGPTEVQSSEKENVETFTSTAEMRKLQKQWKPRKLKKGEEFNLIKAEKLGSVDKEALADELGEIEEELEKEIIRVKLNQNKVEPVKRGATRTVVGDEFEQPQVLGWSFAAFQEEQSN